MSGPTANPTYAAIRSQLQTGDLLCFEGSEPLDFMINLLEDGRYSHVGMVLRDAAGELWFWDAPGCGKLFPDPYMHNQSHTGTRVAALDPLLSFYTKDMQIQTFTWRQLTPSLSSAAGSPLMEFILANDGVQFPGNGAEIPGWVTELIGLVDRKLPAASLDISVGLLLTYLTGKILLLPTTEAFFCAQLVAATYAACGLLSTGPGLLPPNGYAPANFMDQPSPIVLNGASKLGPPTLVAWDNYTPAAAGAL